MSYRTRGKTIDPGSTIARIMFVVGLLLIGLAVFLFVQKKQKLDQFPTTEAVILDTHSGGKHSTGDSYTNIEYKVGGQTYTHRFNDYVFYQSKGGHMTVAYNSDDPNEVYETGLMGYIIPLITAVFGLAFLMPSGRLRPLRRLKGKKSDWD